MYAGNYISECGDYGSDASASPSEVHLTVPQEVITVSKRIMWDVSSVLPFAYRRSSTV